MNRTPRTTRGFTIVELLVVMGMIAVAMALVAPSLLGLTGRSRAISGINQLSAGLRLAKALAIEHQRPAAMVFEYHQDAGVMTQRVLVFSELDGSGRYVFEHRPGEEDRPADRFGQQVFVRYYDTSGAPQWSAPGFDGSLPAPFAVAFDHEGSLTTAIGSKTEIHFDENGDGVVATTPEFDEETGVPLVSLLAVYDANELGGDGFDAITDDPDPTNDNDPFDLIREHAFLVTFNRHTGVAMIDRPTLRGMSP